MSRATEKAAETRHRIIRAVLRIIGEHGVAELTNRRIARVADVSLGSITYHFATQHDLLRESLLYFVGEETRRFTALAQEFRHQLPDLEQAGKLVEQVAASTSFDSEHIAPFEIYVQAGRDPRLHAAAGECFASYDTLTTAILAALGIPDPERTARAVVALICGRQLRHLATGDTGDDLAEMLLLLIGGAQNGDPSRS